MIRGSAICFLFFALSLFAAHAEDYPNRSVRIVVPYPPGGGVDVTARVVGQKLGEILGQQFIVDNRPGASGTIGAEAVAHGNPDGYTLLLSTSDFSTAPELLPKLNFDPQKDLLPVAIVSDNPMIVVANANAPFHDLKGLLETARANANGMNYATPGSGSLNHVIGEWIGVTAHIKVLQVPFKGGVEASTAVASGDVPVGIVSTPSVYPALIDAGKINVIALTGRRSPFLPASWPTLAEAGLPIDARLWLGVFVPAGTPQSIVSRLDQAIGQAMQDDAVRKRMNDIGFGPDYLDRAAFAARIAADAARYGPIIRQSGITAER
ncbi:MAG TPA: tripartite tricarboxylate transporter substrate-binding protein [Xanthobacteraceae bacterium]|jgi:tripartite-type tricarboxylate transporter receptor subunit TctC|nr:tripartite tricarboxylate transporter substrate-binding protein [Xanthobacteraceae bacterium]